MWRLRSRFSEWMWTERPTLAQRLARRLPLYFTDPEYLSPKQWDKAVAAGEPAEFGSRMVISSSAIPMTWTTGRTSTFTSNFINGGK